MKNHRFVPLWIALGALALSFARLAAAAPSNDYFANAAVLSGDAGSLIGTDTTTILGASVEIGEPLHAQVGGNSVWFSWTPQSSGAAIFDTAGSSFDTVLAAYSGRSIVSSKLVAENDDDPTSNALTSRIVFPISAGTTYHIAVAGPDDGTTFTLHWSTVAGGIVHFAHATYFANQASGSATISLERIGNALAPLSVTVNFPSTTDTTATPGVDFDGTPIVANFGVGESTTTVSVPLVVDSTLGGDKNVALALGDPGSAGSLNIDATALLTIRDGTDDPANDLFANATELVGTSGIQAGDNTMADLEPGEPAHAGLAGNRSIWYRFTAPASGALYLDTAGSVVDDSSDPLDTVLAVYTGAAVNALTPVASNDDGSPDLTSRLVVPVTVGTTYFIAIDSRDTAGQTSLQWAFAAGGILQFSQPEFVVGDDATTATITVSRLGSTAGAVSAHYSTAENNSAQAAVNYTPIADGVVNFAAGQSSATFTVTLLNNTSIDSDRTLLVQLAQPAGAQLGAPATASLRIAYNPPNDNFAAATVLAGVGDIVDASNVGARLEPGEPQHGGPGGHSIWFKWRAPATGAVSFDTTGSTDDQDDPLDTLIAAYTGTAVNALTRVAADDNQLNNVNARIAFPVVAGTTYYIAVDGRDGAVGDISLAWVFSNEGLFQFSVASYQVNEGGEATITVTRTNAASLDAVSVDLSIDGITASEGDDYEANFASVDFHAGDVTQTFTVPTHSDSLNEGDETVQLTLSSSTNSVVIGDRNVAILTINDRQDDPPNDYFAGASALSGSTGSTFAVTTGASRELNEPLHAGLQGSHSVWFKWTATAAGAATFDTAGSIALGGAPLDTAIAIYTGTAVNSLVSVASNDDAQPGVKTSRVSFNTVSGTTYYIAVDSAGDVGGEVSLSWTFGTGGLLQFHQPEYVVRENASPAKVTITVDRIGASTGAVSATWTAQVLAGGGAKVGEDFPAQSGTVSLGAGVTSATFDVAITNDSIVEPDESFAVVLSAPTGGATLSSTTVSATVVIKDDDAFAAATALTGSSGAITGTNLGADVTASSTMPGGHAIWFRWTAPASGNVQFDTAGSGTPAAPLDTLLAAYTGTSLALLQPIASNDDAAPGLVTSRINFTAIVGTTYQIAVDAKLPLTGDAQLHWLLTTGGAFGFDAPTYRVNETAGSVQVMVTRSGTNVGSATVDYDTVPGTALAPQNFTRTTGTLVFAAGQLSRAISIPILRTAVGEITFSVQLKNPSQGAIVAQSSAEVRILDVDLKPANDSFAGASVLTPDDGTFTSSNVGATRDAGENLPSNLLRTIGSGRTVWFKWQAPSSGDVTFSTDGSTVAGGTDPLDTVMAAFTGTDPKHLIFLAENDESPDSPAVSAVTFHAISGRTYYIVVDTVGDVSGSIELAWSLAPPDEGPLMLPVPGFTPTVKFTENYKDTPKSDGGGGFDAIGADTISGTMILSLAEVDINGLNGDSAVSVAIGDFEFDGVLSDDPSYRVGKKSASFKLTVDTDSGATKTVGSVVFSWTATTLTVKVNASKNVDYSFDLGFTGPVETTDSSVTFGGVSGDRILYVTGTTTTTDYRGLGLVDLVTTSIAGVADYTPPTATIVAPTAVSADTTTVDISGTAADNFSVADVMVSVNGDEAAEADVTIADTLTTATWSLAAVPLRAGLNTLAVIAIDESGNTSTTTRTINRPLLAPVSLVVSGQGTINSSFTSPLLEVGRIYTVTAVPANGWLFRGWKGSDGSSSSVPAFTFTMGQGLQLTASFVPNPFQNLRGTFNGFARSSTGLPGDTGSFNVALTAAGGVSGTFYLGTKKFSLTGSFDLDGNFTASLPPRKAGGPPVVVSLHLDVTGGSEQITGSVSDGTFFAGVTTDRQTFDATVNPTPLASFKYTIVVSSNAGLRGNANGFLTANLSGDGSVRLAGALADGSTVSTSGFLSKSGVVQFYDTLKATAITGALTFAPAATATVQGVASWFGPAGGPIDLVARGERFVTPAAGSRVFATLSTGQTKSEIGGATFVAQTLQNIVIGTDNKVTVVASVPGLSSITIDVKSGTFTAAGKQSNGKPFTAKGVLLQQSAAGAGFLNVGPTIGGAGYLLIGNP